MIINLRMVVLASLLLFGKNFRDNKIRRGIKIDRSKVQDVDFFIARSGEDLQGAYSIVYDIYLYMNYIECNKNKLYFTEKNMSPNTVTSVGKCNGEVVSSLTAFADSEHGLPSDYLSSKIDDLRKDGKKIFELGSLVTRKEFKNNGHNMFFYNLREVVSHILSLSKKGNVDYIICAVLKEHAVFYEALFGFEKFDEGVFDVDNRKAFLMVLDLENVEDFFVEKYKGTEESKNLYDFLFKDMCNGEIKGSWNEKVGNYFLRNNYLSSELKKKSGVKKKWN